MKRKKIIFVIIAAALAAAMIAGIVQYVSWDSRTPKAQVDLYFINAEGTGIEAEQHTVRYRDSSDLIQNTMAQLLRGPSGSKRGRIIPDNAELLHIILDNESISAKACSATVFSPYRGTFFTLTFLSLHASRSMWSRCATPPAARRCSSAAPIRGS